MMHSILPIRPWLHCFTILCYLFILLHDSYMGVVAFASGVYHPLINPAPPWNLDKIATLYYPRHFWKHGRYCFTPRHPLIRWKHVSAFLLLLYGHSTSHDLHHPTMSKLRHIQWESAGQQPWSPPYYEVDYSSMQHFDPSHIMPRRSQPTVTWESSSPSPWTLTNIHIPIDLFPDNYNPSEIVHILCFSTKMHLTCNDAPLLYTLATNPTCYNALSGQSSPPLIADTGASVCISPLRSDFVTYRCSTMKITDLSSCRSVTGEGMINWHVIDNKGNQVTIKIPGCHIPTAEVRLLSPQLLHARVGGNGVISSDKISFSLGSGEVLDTPYCPRMRLPCFTLAGNYTTDHASFWSSTFEYTPDEALTYPSLLTDSNTNLTAGQNEVLMA